MHTLTEEFLVRINASFVRMRNKLTNIFTVNKVSTKLHLLNQDYCSFAFTGETSIHSVSKNIFFTVKIVDLKFADLQFLTVNNWYTKSLEVIRTEPV